MQKRAVAYVTMFLAAAVCVGALAVQAGQDSGGGAGRYVPGTYTGEGQGFNGAVVVTLTVDADSVAGVTVAGEGETPAIGGAALEALAEQIKTAQSADIDGVSGATLTSDGAREGAAAAFAAAGAR